LLDKGTTKNSEQTLQTYELYIRLSLIIS